VDGAVCPRCRVTPPWFPRGLSGLQCPLFIARKRRDCSEPIDARVSVEPWSPSHAYRMRFGTEMHVPKQLPLCEIEIFRKRKKDGPRCAGSSPT
jgi:hypothetical protein